MDAIKHQGQRADLTCAQDGHKLEGKKSRDIVAEEAGVSKNQVGSLVRVHLLGLINGMYPRHQNLRH